MPASARVGPRGPRGYSVLNGDHPPSFSDGLVGDFWIDTDALDLYGPKAGGGWPVGVSLVGPPGAAASTIADVAGLQAALDGLTDPSELAAAIVAAVNAHAGSDASDAELTTAIAAEVANRDTAIAAEATVRASADTALDGRLDSVESARVVNAGALGSTETLNISGTREVWLLGTLDANLTLTIPDLGLGKTARLFLTQDATGGRTVTITAGAGSQAATVNPTALTTTEVIVYSPDGTTLIVVAPADAAASLSVSGPTDHGLLAWTHDLIEAGSAGAGSGQDIMFLSKIKVPVSLSVTNLHYFLAGSAPSAVTGGTLALFSSSGMRLGITAAQTTAWQSVGPKSHAIVGGPISVPGGPGVFVWGAMHCEAITGTWSPMRATLFTGQANLGLTAATYRSATQNTTTMPSSFTPSSNVDETSLRWMGLS